MIPPISRGEARLASLCTEYARNPLGIDALSPRLSWRLDARDRSVMQHAHQIRMAFSTAMLRDERLFWDSGRVEREGAISHLYDGPALASRQQCFWQMRTWTGAMCSEWSEVARWEMGLLNEADWTAKWIEPVPASWVTPQIQGRFWVRSEISRARVYASSRGLYRLHLNGLRVGDSELTPGFTSYRNRIQYQTYDVTPMLRIGENIASAWLAPGWFAGEIGIGAPWDNRPRRYGESVAFLMQLEVEYREGSIERFVTDETWTCCEAPILSSELYAGEVYDARRDLSFADISAARSVRLASDRPPHLVAQMSPSVRCMEVLEPKAYHPEPSGPGTIVDFGQNLVGRVRLSIEGSRGAAVTLQHAEALDHDGGLYRANLVCAEQTDRYTLKGGGAESYEPHFTFHGFRYLKLDCGCDQIDRWSVVATTLRTGFEITGRFESSNPKLNRLHENIVWSMRGNFVDIPTDCPQRGERLGWTGDAQIFAPTAVIIADVATFYRKWLVDLALDQRPDGSVPWVIPDALEKIQNSPIPEWNERLPAGAAGWGDAAVILPWTLYQAYGDIRFLRDQFDSMRRWVDYERSRVDADLIWRRDFQFADWYAWGGHSTRTDLVATAYFARSVQLVSRSAELLGRVEESRKYTSLFAAVCDAFIREYAQVPGRVGNDTQTAYVLSLMFDLLPPAHRAPAAKRLAEKVREDGHLTTGFLGTPGLLFALSNFGYLDEAYDLLLREDPPSWLYGLKHGATTIWERWDAIAPDGTFFHDPANNSFNHYAYGAVGEWLYRVIGGINPDPKVPGYKNVIIKPQPGGALEYARVEQLSPYGKISSHWRIEGDLFRLSLTIPPNSTAAVHLPCDAPTQAREGNRSLSQVEGIVNVQPTKDGFLMDLGSGEYEFAAPYVRAPKTRSKAGSLT
jgi:alpha-L-rhamnosidase